ncbi:5'-methylthioadenosine nucleosidase [Candidatus Thioglobus sp.]|nr:5'-methylthioadenosine nucleosidase [Candidatus Thioglobus sp.]
MKDILILVALEEELPKDSLKEFHVEYTGVGKINACFRTIEVINAYSPKLIINYGTAGSLKDNLTGLYEVSNFFQRDMDASELGFKIGETPFDNISNISFGNDGLSIGTGDNFVSQHPKIITDLVDMEAYAIAKVCLLKKINFLCFKYISDNADKNASNNWEKNISNGKISFQKKMREMHMDLIVNY